jgi:hypothetical protein
MDAEGIQGTRDSSTGEANGPFEGVEGKIKWLPTRVSDCWLQTQIRLPGSLQGDCETRRLELRSLHRLQREG